MKSGTGACRAIVLARAIAGMVLLMAAVQMDGFTGLPADAATVETYGDYSLMFERSAGQYFSDGAVVGQWAWSPQSATESHISWGDQPASWPPSSAEKFIRHGNWVMIDGWWGNGTYYTQRVTRELIGDANCNHLVPISSSKRRQHYVKWTVPSSAYCLKAWGTIRDESSGWTFAFSHTQIWYPPGACWNQYQGSQTCIKQWESWWDNNGEPAGTAIEQKLTRDQLLARGIGNAFTILQYFPSSWRADLRFSWRW